MQDSNNNKQIYFLRVINFVSILTRSIRDSETSIDFVQGPPGSRKERVKSISEGKICSVQSMTAIFFQEKSGGISDLFFYIYN